jgi:hypothetical protein
MININSTDNPESFLVSDFKSKLKEQSAPFSILKLATEFNHMAGRTDIIGATKDGALIAFEAKICNWRVALTQAYRNTSFADYSYVLLPEACLKKAMKAEYEFIRRGVGLCSINEEGITIKIPAAKSTPIQPWVTSNALNYVVGE